MISSQFLVIVIFCVFDSQAVLNCTESVLRPPFDLDVTSPDSRTVLLSWKNRNLGTLQCSNVWNVVSYNNSVGQFVEKTIKDNFKFSSKPFMTWTIAIKIQTENDKSSEWAYFPNITTPEDAPEEPSSLSTFFDEPTKSIFVNWTKPAETNGIIRAYSVKLVHEKWRHFCFNPVPEIAFNVSSKTNSVVFNTTELKFSSACKVYVAAITVKKGPESTKVVFTPESVPEAAPRYLAVSNITSTSFILRWQPPRCAYSNGRIAYYNLSSSNGQETKNTIADRGVMYYNGGIPNTKYEVMVVACTSVGCGKYSVKATLTTLASTPLPGPPRDLEIFSVTIDSISITWLPMSYVTMYGISYKKQNTSKSIAGTYEIIEVQKLPCKNSKLRVNRLCHTIVNLEPSADYIISVAAFDDHGEQSIKTNVTGRTENLKPEAPNKLELVNRTTTSLFISWLEPVKTSGELIEYRINVTLINLYGLSRIDGEVVYSFNEHNPNVTIHNIKGLEPASTYNVTVEAMNRAGYGQPVHQLFYTRNLVPQDTVRLEIGKITKDSVQLLIKLTDNYDGPISAYLVLVKDVTHKQVKREALEFNTYNQSKTEYIAAKLKASELRKEGISFTVGNGKYYDEFYNAPLQNGHEYIFGTAVLSEVHGEKQIVFGYLYEAVYVTESLSRVTPSLTSPVTPQVGFINSTITLTVILVFGVFFFILYYKKPELFSRAVNEICANCKTGSVQDRAGSTKSEVTEMNLYDELNTNSEYEMNLYELCSTPSLDENRPNRETTLYDDCLDIKNSIKPNPIDIKDFEIYVQDGKTSSIISQEYKTMSKGMFHPCKAGKLAENKSKNRYLDLLPYDHCRVTLEEIEGFNYSDYINANYIQNYKGDPKYIATQGPKCSTVIDFWRMVWQENTCKIIMLTNLVEGGKNKCEKYWPEYEDKYGPFTVKLEDTVTYANYVIRTIILTKNGFEREIKQFHFTTWPDHGIPAYSVSVTTFLEQIRNYRENSESPIVVHGCAGIGRTGTFILLCNMIEMAKDTHKVDLQHGLWSIRQCRVNLVETLEQYMFVYHALLDYLGADIYCELI